MLKKTTFFSFPNDVQRFVVASDSSALFDLIFNAELNSEQQRVVAMT